MEKKNYLSQNLRNLQKLRNYTITEFADELGIPKSTLQTVITTGNVTLDTLVRLQGALGISLDDMVFCPPSTEMNKLQYLLRGISFYDQLSPEKQTRFRHLISELLDIFSAE